MTTTQTPELDELLRGAWRPARVYDTTFEDYEINLLGEVRRVTAAPGARPGSVIGYSKDGTRYRRLGLRRHGETLFAPWTWVLQESFPELRAGA